ncbi:hypothetical protein [Domibacillus mangrovi]|uniref:hypothetical protein n=1 Tax=Domibacillus mangrovi TaxID=1714354 RepID=UPI0011610326
MRERWFFLFVVFIYWQQCLHTINYPVFASGIIKFKEEYEESIRETDLPKTREEFEIRANLFYLNFEIKNYLIIKRNIFKRSKL